MTTYTTKQGDMWDGIAFTQMGDTKYTDTIMTLNSKYIKYYIFPAGIELTIPSITPQTEASSILPWKKVKG